MKLRIGHSWDVHRLVENRKLILGGLEIPYEKGLLGHSDADVLCHVVAESILGALALGDLGTYFPDNDDRYYQMDSQIIVKEAIKMMEQHGFQINNLDVTIYAELPKMKPYKSQIANNLANILKTEMTNINIKATTHEKLGYIGEGLAIACEAVVLLISKEIV